MATKLQGAFTALITPMKDDGSIDYEGWQRLIAFQLDKGISGLVPLGTTGESPTLLDDEEEVMLKQAAALCKGRVPLIVGAGSNSTRDAVRYTERAAKCGADYALVVTPYYNKPNDEGIYRHCEAVCKAGLPVIVYNIPSRTGKNIPTPLLARIATLPNIAGVKEASGDLGQMMEVIEHIVPQHPGFTVLSGDDGLTLPLMAAGGDGVISVASNLFPAEVGALTAAALQGDFAAARAMHYRLLPFMRAIFVETNPCPIKWVMAKQGLIASSALRLPLAPISGASEKVLLEALGTLIK
jgi:4-hydroxy-tetrahydrodipicolinate synthase